MTPLAVDLYCGLGGWTEGLLAEGYRVVGFDNERHVYGDERYPAQLVLQDVLTIHGRKFKDAALIVASPPCQAYSYRAMPWKRAKALPPPSNELFDACFRIQAEAIEAAGHFIPLVVENVRGAQPYVGRSKYHFGSFHLWGDVPALMPATLHHKVTGFRFDGSGKSFQSAAVEHTTGEKVPGITWSNYGKPGYKAQAFNGTADKRLREFEAVSFGSGVSGGNARDYCGNAGSGQQHAASIKNGGDWFGAGADCSLQRRASSKGSARKRASALIAKIPLVLSRHIAASWYPHDVSEVSA